MTATNGANRFAGSFIGSGAGLSGITSNGLADNSVTSAKIVDNSVAAADLASDAASLNKVSGGRLAVSSDRLVLPSFGVINTNLFSGMAFQLGEGPAGHLPLHRRLSPRTSFGEVTASQGQKNSAWPGTRAKTQQLPCRRPALVAGNSFATARTLKFKLPPSVLTRFKDDSSAANWELGFSPKMQSWVGRHYSVQDGEHPRYSPGRATTRRKQDNQAQDRIPAKGRDIATAYGWAWPAGRYRGMLERRDLQPETEW